MGIGPTVVGPDGYEAIRSPIRIDGEDIELRETGRYAHRPAWIRDLAQRNGLSVVYEEPVELRRQAGKTLGGVLFVLRG